MNDIAFNPVERMLVMSAINRCGDGQHPAATVESLPFFRPAYAASCLRKALPQLSQTGVAAARSALAKLL